MAKQLGSLRFVGSWGNSTGYKNSLGNGDNYYLRVRTESVSNPRTYAQSVQRAKIRPASLFYRAFESILDHAFLPTGKASRNRLEFLGRAMKLGVPNVFKSENRLPFNLPYQVSAGSLGLSSFCKSSIDFIGAPNSHAIIFEDIACAPQWNESRWNMIDTITLAEFSSEILQRNPLFYEGLEFTFLGVLSNLEDMDDTLADHFSIVLNASDNMSSMEELIGQQLQLVTDFSSAAQSGRLCLASRLPGYGLVAGALIISARAGGSWQYTDSYLGRTAYGIDGFDIDEEDIVRSYMDAGAEPQSHALLQQAHNAPAGSVNVQPVRAFQRVFELVDNSIQPNFPGALVVLMSDGTMRPVVSSNDDIFSISGDFVTVNIDLTSERPILLSDTAWGNLKSVPYSLVMPDDSGDLVDALIPISAWSPVTLSAQQFIDGSSVMPGVYALDLQANPGVRPVISIEPSGNSLEVSIYQEDSGVYVLKLDGSFGLYEVRDVESFMAPYLSFLHRKFTVFNVSPFYFEPEKIDLLVQEV